MDDTGQPVALVTGAGSGIGRAIARRLAAQGQAVVVNDVVAESDDGERGARVVAEQIEAAGGTAEPFLADVADGADREAMMEFVAERFGRLDLLVSNAGVAPRERTGILQTTEESYDRVMAVNLKGAFFLAQIAARRMVEWKAAGAMEAARLVFISSISAYASSPSRAEYCISKAGLSMATRLFADRLAEHGIPVLEVRPGIIETPMTAGVKEKYDRLIADRLLPMRRWGRPEDVARVVCSIARGDLDYCTGESIEVGGGFKIRRL